MYEFDLSKEQKVIDRLVEGPSVVRYRALSELLKRPDTDPEVHRAKRTARDSREIQGLLGIRPKEGPSGRPEWWGPGPAEYPGMKFQPWVFKTLAEAGLGRGEDEVRKAADVCFDMQNPDGTFGLMKGIDKVRFTAEVAYALSLAGYTRFGDLHNAKRWLMMWLKEHWPMSFAPGAEGPGRLLLEALKDYEAFTLSDFAQTVLKSLFEGKKSVLMAAVAVNPVHIGEYDGFLTWGELGFAIGWPRKWQTPFEVMALLATFRNRDGMWGQGGSDFGETLRAIRLWRDLVAAYGPAPEGFKLDIAPVAAKQTGVGTGGRGARPTGRGQAPARPTAPRPVPVTPAGPETPEESSQKRRHVRAFERAGLAELAGEVVGVLGKLGYAPDWAPQYEVSFSAAGKGCTFKLRLEAGAEGQETVLVLTAAGASQRVSPRHWARVLGLGTHKGRPSLQITDGGGGQGAQVRLVLGNAERRVVPKLGQFVSEVAGGARGPASAPSAGPSTGGAARSHSHRRRRPRGGAR